LRESSAMSPMRTAMIGRLIMLPTVLTKALQMIDKRNSHKKTN
jgi:hypothetical protein